MATTNLRLAGKAVPSISIVIPAYNEGDRLGNTLSGVREYFDTRHLSGEVIVVDDGSKDNTGQVATRYQGVRMLRSIENRGKAEAVRCGFLAAQGELILMMDADGSVPMTELDKLIAFTDDADIVIGSRYLPGSHIQIQPPLWRRLNSYLFRLAARKLTSVGVVDTQCGFKLFKRQAGRRVFSKHFVGRASFDVEVLLRGKQFGFKIAEVPIQWKYHKGSKLRFLDLLRMFVDLWAIKRLSKPLL